MATYRGTRGRAVSPGPSGISLMFRRPLYTIHHPITGDEVVLPDRTDRGTLSLTILGFETVTDSRRKPNIPAPLCIRQLHKVLGSNDIHKSILNPWRPASSPLPCIVTFQVDRPLGLPYSLTANIYALDTNDGSPASHHHYRSYTNGLRSVMSSVLSSQNHPSGIYAW